MPVEVTDDLVRHVARLSRLALSEEELAGLHEHFRKILAYVSELQALDTEGIDPAHVATDSSNVYREDAVGGPSLAIGEVLGNAPQATPPYFVVPRILEYGDSRDGLGPGSAALESAPAGPKSPEPAGGRPADPPPAGDPPPRGKGAS